MPKLPAFATKKELADAIKEFKKLLRSYVKAPVKPKKVVKRRKKAT